MRATMRRVGVGIGVVLLLLAGATALFKENIYSPPYAQVFASRSSADVTLYSRSENPKHTFELKFNQEVGNPKHCVENDDVCINWENSASLHVTKKSEYGQHKVTILSPVIHTQVCFNIKGQQLYGGIVLPEYPAQLANLEEVPFITGDPTRMGNSQSVLERFWFSSGGLNIKVDPSNPLFISQNESQLCLIAKNDYPYPNDIPIIISYLTCGGASNLREAVGCFFPSYDKPIPPLKVIRHPIWSTWVEFKRDIDQNKLIQFENDIRKHGFNASVIEVDDAWETCYGTQIFDTKKFPDPKGMVDHFHSLGRLVTLWVHPFLGPGCPKGLFDDYKEHLVKYPNGTVGETTWWNGNEAALYNFLDDNATQWYSNRLDNIIKNYGIDGFKFDAGEVAYVPGMSIYEKFTTLTQPNLYTTNYVKMASKYGAVTEVRVGAESYKYKLMQRIQDVNSNWTSKEWGLRSVIKSVLQLSLVGYGAILPDMVGGNCYHNTPSKELFIRWVQLNTFLPLIQFSITPWSYDQETVNITKKFTSLRYIYSERILKEFNDKTHPVINPIWWISPNDPIAQVTSSEFLLGEDLLVAPVLEKDATSRDVYLPVGSWRDENTGKIYKGPTTIKNYPAPLEILPYFERISNI